MVLNKRCLLYDTDILLKQMQEFISSYFKTRGLISPFWKDNTLARFTWPNFLLARVQHSLKFNWITIQSNHKKIIKIKRFNKFIIWWGLSYFFPIFIIFLSFFNMLNRTQLSPMSSPNSDSVLTKSGPEFEI